MRGYLHHFWLVSVLVLVCGLAHADWEPGDGHKMHFPQLPDPDGWDVSFDAPTVALADDWQCSESGPVSDVHFWGSWQGDTVGDVQSIELGIWSNDPGNPPTTPSTPDAHLWGWTATPVNWTVAGPFVGDQGWYDPATGSYILNDHTEYYQYNILIPPSASPFIQTKDEIYWLSLDVTCTDGAFGWKTSLDHFMDDATRLPGGGTWEELLDPISGESLDLAFVITPEPSTIVLLIGGLLFGWRLRRRRQAA